MSLNDRCRDALDAVRSGAPIDYPAVRDLVANIMRDGADGISFPDGIREAAQAIKEGSK